MKVNENGIKLLKELEGIRLSPYYCPAGKLTVGWGHTGSDIIKDKKYTLEECENLLRSDLNFFSNSVKSLLKCELNDNQFSALVCFVYNIGSFAFKKSTLLRRLNSKEDPVKSAEEELNRWVFVNKEPNKGLLNRRKKEIALFKMKSG